MNTNETKHDEGRERTRRRLLSETGAIVRHKLSGRRGEVLGKVRTDDPQALFVRCEGRTETWQLSYLEG